MEQVLPVVDVGYLSRIFSSLEGMEVLLDADPIVYGPKRLQAKVALCRQHLSRCNQIYLQISSDLHGLTRALRQSKVDFDLQMQDLFANDPDVRSGKNVRDREAIATMKLRAEREAIQRIESMVQDLESVMSVVKAKREDLKDVQGRIRDQHKLCQEELALGGKWGSAIHPGARPINLDEHPKVNTEALDAMHDLVGDLDGDLSISDLDRFVRSELAAQGESLKDSEPVPPVAGAGDLTGEVGADLEEEGDEDADEDPVLQDVVLPQVPVQAEELPQVPSADIDRVLDVLDPEETKQGPKKPSSDIDLDDLLGSFVD